MKRKVLEYDSIENTLLDFTKSYAELKILSNNLTLCLHGRIAVMNDVVASDISDAIMSDGDYVAAFTKAMRCRDAMSSLVIFRALAEDLVANINTCRRLADKMESRIDGSGSSDNEIAVAKKRRAKYNANAEIYEERLKDVVAKYYRLRMGIVGKVADDSNKMRSIFSSFKCQARDDAMRKYSIPQSVADSFVTK